MMHKHHILPKKAPYLEELHEFRLEEEWQVYLTVEGHACQHDVLYRAFRWDGDKIARDGLSGALGKEEALKEAMSLGGRKSGPKNGKEAGSVNGPLNSLKMNSHPKMEEVRVRNGKNNAPLMNSHPNTKRAQVENGNLNTLSQQKARTQNGRNTKNLDLFRSTNGRKTKNLGQKWISLEDGFVSNASGVARHNRFIGVDPSFRKRLDGI